MNFENLSIKQVGCAAIAFFAFIFGLCIFFGCYEIIQPGQIGVVKRMGHVKDDVMTEGLNLKLPIIDDVELWNTKVQMVQVQSDAASEDIQTVHTTIALNFKVNPVLAVELQRQMGQDYATTVILPAVQESVKAVIARYQAESLLRDRAIVRDQMEEILKGKLDKILQDAFIVAAFNIENFSFDPAFDNAVEQKQVAEQEAQRSRNQVAQAEAEADKHIQEARGLAESRKLEAAGEAEAIRIQAEARAEAIRIESEALRDNPAILQLRRIERWDGVMPRVVGSSTDLLLKID